VRKRGLNQRYEENGVLRKTLRKEPPTYAQSPANYKPKRIKIPFAKDFLVAFNPSKHIKLARLFISRQDEKLYTAALPTVA